MKIVKIILDVMSPAQQTIVDLVNILSRINGITRVDVTLSELERDVEDFKVTLEGDGLVTDEIKGAIKEFGGVIRNIDNIVSAEEYIPSQNSDKLSAAMLVLARYSDSKIKGIGQIYHEFDDTLKYIRSKRDANYRA